jgi:hypothetical protein
MAAPLLAYYRGVTGIETHQVDGAFATHPRDPVLDRWLLPSWRELRSAAARLRPVQETRLSTRLALLGGVVTFLLVYLLLEAGPS